DLIGRRLVAVVIFGDLRQLGVHLLLYTGPQRGDLGERRALGLGRLDDGLVIAFRLGRFLPVDRSVDSERGQRRAVFTDGDGVDLAEQRGGDRLAGTLARIDRRL